jgi:hypothetical protein
MVLKLPNNRGNILIGILIALAIFAILSHALFTLISSSYRILLFNRARVTARNLAQEQIEVLRNIPYEEVGTAGGIPSGNVPQEQEVERNGFTFLVTTQIIYIDDPYDGLAPADMENEDYKRVHVEVSWEGLASSRRNPVTIATNIAPAITGSSTGGTIRILVYDANGEPLSGADVRIFANTIDPAVDVTRTTGLNGEIVLPGAQPCSVCYEITVTKDDHSTDRTYSDAEVANPIKPHLSVLLGGVTQMSFSIDRVGSINITSRDSRENEFAVLGSVPFRLRGEKLIGFDTEGLPVYKYDNDLITNSAGDIALSNMEWGIYRIIMPEGSVYDIAGSIPLLPFYLLPDDYIDLQFTVKESSTHSLLTIFKDPSQNLLEDVYIYLYDDEVYEEATLSGKATDPDFGQNLFLNLDETVIYHLVATASGFLDRMKDVFVSGYTVDEIVLSPE